MIIFKEKTHSVLENLKGNSLKENILLGLAALPGVKELFNGALGKDNLESLYHDLPESIKNKIMSKEKLSNSEVTQEIRIAERSGGIQFRQTQEGRNALEELNSYYRETNPVSQVGKY